VDQPPDQVAEVDGPRSGVDLGREVARPDPVLFHLLFQDFWVDLEPLGVLDPHPDEGPVEVGEELVSLAVGEEVGGGGGFGVMGVGGHESILHSFSSFLLILAPVKDSLPCFFLFSKPFQYCSQELKKHGIPNRTFSKLFILLALSYCLLEHSKSDVCMTDEFLSLHNFSFKRTTIDRERLARLTSEDGFMSIAVELMKEISIVTSILACSCPPSENNNARRWTRNEAILGGLFVRLAKLQSGYLDAVCQKRSEIASILERCLSETIINLIYLIQIGSEELYNEYVTYSLKEEKRLIDLINENVTCRGDELPIESRMRSSIMRSFDSSDLTPDQIDKTNRKSWGGNIFERATSIGLSDEAYRALFGLPSHAIHGNWQDLLRFHVKQDRDGFLPSVEWTTPRPQPIFIIALLSAAVCRCYLNANLPDCEDRRFLLEMITDCEERIDEADELHEQFLQKENI